MRLAFFGGSFDPPHLGHLHIARTALARLQLDRVLLAPTGRQPLKRHGLAPFADRLHMLQLLTADDPQLIPSAADAPEPGGAPNYTADTLDRLAPTLAPGTQLFFLAGADTFLTLAHWHRAEALLRPQHAGGLLSGWILAARPGFPLASLASALPPGYLLGEAIQQPGPVLTQPVLDPSGSPAVTLHLLADLEDPSTATRIREALAAAGTPPHLPPAITRYIDDRGLYRVLR